jgi:hypothetical protein
MEVQDMAAARPGLAIQRICAANAAAREAVRRSTMLTSRRKPAIWVRKALMRKGSGSTPNRLESSRK